MKNFVLSFFLLLVPFFVLGAGESVLSNCQQKNYLAFDNLGQEKIRKVINIYLLADDEECRIKGSLTISDGKNSVTVAVDVTASTCDEAARIVSNSLNSLAAKFDSN